VLGIVSLIIPGIFLKEWNWHSVGKLSLLSKLWELESPLKKLTNTVWLQINICKNFLLVDEKTEEIIRH